MAEALERRLAAVYAKATDPGTSTFYPPDADAYSKWAGTANVIGGRVSSMEYGTLQYYQ